MSNGWETALVGWLAAQLPLGLLLGMIMGAGRDDDAPMLLEPAPRDIVTSLS